MHEGRSFEVLDMVANSIGSISGAFIELFGLSGRSSEEIELISSLLFMLFLNKFLNERQTYIDD
jgi:hypothetical protein